MSNRRTARTMCPMNCHPTFCGMLVTVEDANGPRGGVDQVCRITANLTSQKKPLVAESMHETTGGAIKLAFDKMSHAIGRTLDRRQKMQKRLSAVH